MADFTDKDLSLAGVYARAVLRLAPSPEAVRELLDEVRDFAALAKSDANVADFLANPRIPVGERERLIEKLFRGRGSDLFVNALQVLNRKGRLGLLVAIAHALDHAARALAGRVEVNVDSAVPLTDPLRDRLRRILAEKTGKQPQLIEKVKPDLLGGLVVRVGDAKFDASLRSQLNRLSEALSSRAIREIHGKRNYVEA